MKTCLFSILLSLLMVVLFPVRLCVADQQTVTRLINDYIQASSSNDPSRLKASWTALNRDPEAVRYMRANMPKLDYLFRVRGLYMELEQLQSGRSQLFGGENPQESLDESVRTLRNDLSPLAAQTVEKFSLSEIDRSLRTNRDIVLEAQGRPLQDNRSIALSNPNQNRITNTQRIQNRLDSMYSGKFQEAPEQLVPRWNSFPKSRTVSKPDVTVRGLSTKLRVRSSLPVAGTFAVIVNGRTITDRMDVDEVGTTVDLYLETGINTVRVVETSRYSKDAGFLYLMFDRSAREAAVELDLDLLANRTLQVEAVP